MFECSPRVCVPLRAAGLLGCTALYTFLTGVNVFRSTSAEMENEGRKGGGEGGVGGGWRVKTGGEGNVMT